MILKLGIASPHYLLTIILFVFLAFYQQVHYTLTPFATCDLFYWRKQRLPTVYSFQHGKTPEKKDLN
jgi:hypothetical protein